MEAIVMTKLGLTMETGIIDKWLVSEGQPVKKGDPVAEISTEKLTNTIESTQDGTILKLMASEGDELPVGTVIAYVGEIGETIPA